MSKRPSHLELILLLLLPITAIATWVTFSFGKTQPPATASALSNHVDLRGRPPGWMELDYPEDWFVSMENEIDIQSFDPSDEYARGGDRMSIRALRSYSEVFVGDWPPGTITDTVTIDGITANRYTAPTESTENGGLSGFSVVEFQYPLTTSGNPVLIPYYITLAVQDAEDQASFDEREATLYSILESLNFVDDQVSTQPWDITTVDSTTLTNVRGYEVEHPTGWGVSETPAGLIVSTPPPPGLTRDLHRRANRIDIPARHQLGRVALGGTHSRREDPKSCAR